MKELSVGFLLVNKPIGITSAECLNRIKFLLPRKIKVGHAGTLDAFASGLLVVGIGRAATKQLGFIMRMKKQYLFTARMDIETDTLDSTGKILRRHNCATVTSTELETILETFKPSYEQMPPIFSALKHNGRRLSDLARGKTVSKEILTNIVSQKSRPVTIYLLRPVAFNLPRFTCNAIVSHGTYVRSLVRDIGSALGVGATTEKLVRTAIGHFMLENAVSLSDLSSDNILNTLITQIAI